MSNLILVNKQNGIKDEHIPTDLDSCDKDGNEHFKYNQKLRREACIEFLKLRRDAIKSHYDIYAFSGFRTDVQQREIFKSNLNANFQVLKKEFPYESDEKLYQTAYKLTAQKVALPGHSEHQIGLAVDIACFYRENYDEDISNDEEVDWMRKNACNYGYILRYPKGKEDITGFMYEPWHYRYVGEEYSHDFYDNDLTLEEYHKRLA